MERELDRKGIHMPRLRAQFVLFDGFDPLDAIAPFAELPGTHATGERTSA